MMTETKRKLWSNIKTKKITDLTQTEKDELLLALLQRAGMANKNGKIKSTAP